jgi:hypothetical protein
VVVARAVAARTATVPTGVPGLDGADSGGRLGEADTNYLPTIQARPEGAPVELGAVTFRRTAF